MSYAMINIKKLAAAGFEAHGGLILFSHALYSGVVRPANIACNIYVICCHQGLVAGHHAFGPYRMLAAWAIPVWDVSGIGHARDSLDKLVSAKGLWANVFTVDPVCVQCI